MALSLSCSAMLNTKFQVQLNVNSGSHKGHEKLKDLITRTGVPSVITSPHISLQKGNWVKLICGASFEDVVDIRNLSLIYTLAGVDCIDCAAEASVVSAVSEGIEAARGMVPIRRPWVMISVNDDEDLHFRKAEFDPDDCPADCSRPCELVCPANAISQQGTPGVFKGGVVAERCYGCGRCFPVCPYDKIRAITYIRDINATAELLKRDDVDAMEIHTSGRRAGMFKELWTGLGDSIDNLRLVAVSLPDLNDETISAMSSIYSIMEANLHCFNLWQLDGRPMSGDIGRGATREAIAFAKSLVSARGKPKGFLQLAGGTNAHTVNGLKKEGLFQTTTVSGISSCTSGLASFFGFSFLWSFVFDIGFYKQISNAEKSEDEIRSSRSFSSPHALVGGVAFGGYARKIVGKVLNSMQSQHGHARIENYPEHLVKAVMEALALIGTVKCYST